MSSRPDKQPYGEKQDKETMEDPKNPGQGRKPEETGNQPGQGQQKETDRGGR